MSDDNLSIEYMPLGELVGKMHPENPKSHDIGQIIESYKAHGYVASGVIDGRTDLMLAGHGRIEALASMKRQKIPPPAGIRNGGDDWFVPVQVGYSSKDDTHAKAYLIADNKLTSLGGWDDVQLANILQELANSDTIDIEASGFDGDELDLLLADLGGTPSKDNRGLKISPELFERHDYIVLCFDNEFDWIVAREWFALETVEAKLQGSSTLKQKGLGRVVNGSDFLRKIDNG